MSGVFTVPFRRIPGATPLVVDHDLQADVATDGSDQVEHAITVPASLSGSQLAIMIIAPEQLVSIEEGALDFEVKIGGEVVEDGEGNALYGYAYVLAAPAAGVHTVLLTFAADCTPATFLAVLSGVRADSGTGSAEPDSGGIGTLSEVPILPPSDYAFALDFVAAVAPVVYTAIHGQTVLATDADVLSAASSFKSDLNAGVSQVTAWQLDSAVIRMHVALIFEAATTPDDPDPPPAEISDIAIWLLNEPSGAVAADSVGDADGVITGSMEYGLDDLVDGADTCMAGDGIGAKIIAPHDATHELTTYTLDFVAQADTDPQIREVWLGKDRSLVGERPPGGISIERVWSGSASRIAAYTRNAGAVVVWIEDGATPDAQHGVANWPAEDAFRIHLVVDPTHVTEPTRLYLEGTKVATSINTQGLQSNIRDWSMFCFKSDPATFSSFADGMIYRVRLRDLPLSDAEVAAEVAGEPAVSISHGAPPGVDYDAAVAEFDADLVSYWKFQNTGTDENGTQDATFTGSPEFSVETIVDLDQIAEGASADGTCIAWPGSAGTYAQVVHNAAHKTAAGTIVVTFQRDTASTKSTLVAADRPVGGTASGAGGFSMEVEASGASRCFLRNTSGVATVLLGTAGDVALNQAYTAVFKWGVGGLSYAIWNATGTLVRRLTNALADGLSGTSPIRFGSWHTDGAQHDGPYGRVIWLDRRISNAEEEDLARARTISRGGGEEPPPPGEFTPFPFVTQRYPTVTHAGVTAKPGYNASNPRAASFIDPMSGLEVFRVTGNLGANVLLRGSVDSGLDWPRCSKPENNPRCQRSWNADGSLLMLPESKARSGDPANPARTVLITSTGAHMSATGPWQIIRAGAASFAEVPSTGWFWDPLNPLRAYAAHDDGMYEWWPAGGDGHSVGQKTKLFNWPSGFGDWASPRGGRSQSSHDGLWYHAPVRRNSDGRWGGIRINLLTGASNSFVNNLGTQNDDESWGMSSTGALGIHATGAIEGDGANSEVYNMITGAQLHSAMPGIRGHSDFTQRGGREYSLAYSGGGSGQWHLGDLQAGTLEKKGDDPSIGVEHPSCRNYKDTFENYGATGGSTSGVRYGICSVSSPNSRQGIFGVRLGVNDLNQWRYIAHPRTVRSENTSELHAAPSPGMEYVAFNSNWTLPGVETANDISTYIVIIPSGWRSPNNDGSAV